MDPLTFYAEELKKAADALDEARERQRGNPSDAAVKAALSEAVSHRNTVIRSAIKVGRMNKARVGELVRLHRNTVGTISGESATGQLLLLPQNTTEDETNG